MVNITVETRSEPAPVESPPGHPPLRRRGPDRCVSERRIAANRRNCRRSTGPRTAAGKAVVRLNALRHGLDAAPGVLLPGEDPAEREALARAYREDLRPTTADEADLVARMAETGWLERRAEAAAYAAAEEAIATHGPGTNVLAMEACAGGRGPFLRAEAWSCRLTGRFLRLARQFDRARGAARAASRPGGTKPLRGHASATPGRSAARRSAGPGPSVPQPCRAYPPIRSGPALAPLATDRRGAGAPAGNEPIADVGMTTRSGSTPPARQRASNAPRTRNEAIAPSPIPAGLMFQRVPRPRGTDRKPGSHIAIAGNKAIGPDGSATGPVARPHADVPQTAPAIADARNKAIVPPAAARRLLGRAVGSVAAGLTGGYRFL